MEKSREIALLYQISLSIGSSLDLQQMLRHALTTMMRTLNCSSAQVLQHSGTCRRITSPESDSRQETLPIEWSECFSFPRLLKQDKEYQNFIGSFLLPQDCSDLRELGARTPLINISGERHYYTLNLPGFGLLFLQKSGNTFEKSFLQSLQVIANKLANSAQACIEHHLLQEQINIVKFKEAKISTMLDSIGDAVIVVSPESRIIRMNPVAENLTGFSFTEAADQHIDQVFRIVNSLTGKPAETPVDEVFKSGRTVELANHTALIRKDATELQISDSCAPIFDESGTITGVILIFRDITAEYEQREKLRRSERYNRLLLEAIPDLIFVLDHNGCFINVHAAMSQLKLSPDQFVGRQFAEILPTDVAVLLDENLKNLFKTRQNQLFNYSLPLNGIISDFECRLVYMDDQRALALSRDITEKRLAEEALKASEEKFRQITENMGEVFWLRNFDNTRMLYINPAYEKVWGRSCASLYEKPESFIESVFDEDKPRVYDEFAKYLETGEFNVDYRIVRPDGKIRWVNARSFPVKDSENKIIRHTGIAVDITDRRRIEEELANKSQELERYFTSSLDLLCIADLNGFFRKLNPEWEKCLGWRLQELEGLNFMTLVHPDDVDATLSAMRALEGRTDVRNFVNRYRCKDGNYRFIQWRSTTIGVLIYAVARDVTEARGLEAKLKRHDEIETLMANLSSMFINIPAEETDGKINLALESVGKLLDVDRVYVFKYTDDLEFCSNTYEWCNEGIEAQIENLQSTPSDLLPWWTERMRNLQNIALSSLDELPPDATGEREVLEPQGIRSILVVPLSLAGKAQGFIGFDSVKAPKIWTQEDIAPLELLANIIANAQKRKEDEKRLRELNATLEKRVEKKTAELQKVQSQLYIQDKMVAIGQLAAGLAHEINNPVSFIATNFVTLEENLELLIEIFNDYRNVLAKYSNESPDLKKQFDLITEKEKTAMVDYVIKDLPKLFSESKNGFKRVTEIIASMRNFARQDSVNQWVQYNLNEGIRETLVIARNAYKYSAKLELELGDIPTIQANPGQINQVLLNLIINSAQALSESESESSSRGIIRVRTWCEQEEVYCEISDNGPGIPENTLAKVFDPFFSTKAPGKGTGLGLSISFDIVVNKHSGQISVKNLEQGGACFSIVLPVKQKDLED